MQNISKFFSLTLVFLLTSCDFFSHTKDFRSGETIEGKPIQYSFDMKDKEKINECLNETLNLALTGNNYDAFENSYNKLDEYYGLVSDAHEAEELKYYMYGKKENQDLSLELYEILTNIFNKANQIHYAVFRNDFRVPFYGDKTDEQIIDEIGPEYTEEYYKKNNELKVLEANYHNLDPESDKYDTEVDNLYIDYVKTANELAKVAGYNNYLDYSYKNNYKRPYSYKETNDFFIYTKDYALPYFNKLFSTYVDELNSLSYSDLSKFRNFINKNGFTYSFSLIEDYKDYFGGEFKTIFDDLWYDSRNYYISYEEDATVTAFTSLRNGEPYVFFGNRFEPTTIVHEFGHYYDYSINGNTHACYDLAETQSQGNEMLFINYLYHANKFSKEVSQTIIDYQYLDTILSVLISSMVNELEKKAYLDDDLTIDDIHQYEQEVMKAMPLDDLVDFSAYWRGVVVDSACYYFSYAASAIGALEIATLARSSLNGAIDKYNKLINYNKENEDNYLKIYKDAGLSSPFEEVTFKTIFK